MIALKKMLRMISEIMSLGLKKEVEVLQKLNKMKHLRASFNGKCSSIIATEVERKLYLHVYSPPLTDSLVYVIYRIPAFFSDSDLFRLQVLYMVYV
mmetsp:Transcript_21484/g.20766  ORF Transcript_21484/g.20766 Transcript_21484/m.20766 type:complete len:96 (+) Transcript_21484:133-420(+)